MQDSGQNNSTTVMTTFQNNSQLIAMETNQIGIIGHWYQTCKICQQVDAQSTSEVDSFIYISNDIIIITCVNGSLCIYNCSSLIIKFFNVKLLFRLQKYRCTITL